MRQSTALGLIAAVATIASACSVGVGAPDLSGATASARPAASAPPAASARPAASPSGPGAVGQELRRCEDVEGISASPDRYRDSPVYVANEMPIDEVQAWARTKPGFEEIWIARDHGGWITVAFSVDADARQAELRERFPDVGVVAVGVDWTRAELMGLQRRLTDEIAPLFDLSSSISVTQGVVSVNPGVLEADRVAAIAVRFAGERICIEGVDPQDAPPEGPQPQAGDGWRLLADEQDRGEAYRTGVASDDPSYQRLWTTIGLDGATPAVDFRSEVVIWFGAVYGSSCPDLRLDDVVVDDARALLHAEIVLVDAPAACTADANAHAYLVAVDRAKLPVGPFAIQLGADDPPGGAPEERTLVDADLSRPGAVAAPGEVHGDPSLPPPDVLESGAFIEPGFDQRYRLYVHCGTEWLGEVNDVKWRADVPDENLDYIPPRWRSAVDAKETIELSIILRVGPEPLIEATANDHTVTYRPSTEELPGCD